MRKQGYLILALLIVFSVSALGAQAQGGAQPVTFLTGPQEGEPLDIALAYINGNKEDLGLSAADLSDMVVTDNYVSKHTGTTHIHLRQRYEGIEVFHGNININITKDGSVINMGNSFVGDLAAKVVGEKPALSAVEAVEAAAEHLGLAITQPLAVESFTGGQARAAVLSTGGIYQEPKPVKLMYQRSEGSLWLSWDMLIHEVNAPHLWSMRVSAADGQVLSKIDLVISDDWGAPGSSVDQADIAGETTLTSPAVAESSSLLPDSYRVYPIPVESPNHTSPLPPADGRVLVPNPADPTASPYGWHDTDGVAGAEFTTTQGNNVHAYADADMVPDDPDPGSSPDGGLGLVFDFPIDLTMEPSAYQPAAVTNLFYWTNLMHDVNYLYGFDEAAGNFQENNYDNGGMGSDYVFAEAQDGSNDNNAHWTTTVDGANPRIEIGLWTATSPYRDGDLDGGIISHEYGHGISSRLVGGSDTVECLTENVQESYGMGEGWSDWQSLIMTMEPGDAGTDPRGIGTYGLNQPTTGTGIRPAPYTTNMAVNGYTYGDIYGLTSEHTIGFVWATMLWEMNWGLIADHGFNPDIYDPSNTGGNNLAHQLVIDGLKLTPCSPGFVDGRQAILLADQVLTGGANQCTIWEAFAKRGLGFSADQGSSDSTIDGTEAFDLPPVCVETLKISKSADPDPVNSGGTLTYSLEARNDTLGTLTDVTISDMVPANTTYVPGSASDGGAESGGMVTWPGVTLNSGDSIIRTFQVQVDGGLGTVQLFFDDMESGSGNWSVSHGAGSNDWGLGTTNPHSPTHAWFAEAVISVSDQYLTTASAINLTANPTLRVWHLFITSSGFDGGVIEISTDGSTWEDLGPYMTQNGYNSLISGILSNPIGGRNAFSGDSGGYVETVIDLSSYSGQSVWIRFRMATSALLSGGGWYVDDVEIADESAIVNTACVTASEGDSDCATIATLVNAVGGPPTIDVDPTTIAESLPVGTSSVTALTINNLGSDDLTWTIDEASDSLCLTRGDLPWLSVTPSAGTTSGGNNTLVDVTLDAAGLTGGDYTGSLCLDSNDPSNPTVVVPVTLAVYNPVAADFSGDPTNGLAPLLVDFTNLSTGDYNTCSWDFGDGTSDVCSNPSHTYTQAGTYQVSLTVSGPGGSDIETKPGYIAVYETVAAAFSGDPTSGPAPLLVDFTNLSSGSYDTCTWDFGDLVGTSTECNDPSYTYNSPGTYQVSLTVSGSGGSDTEMKAGYITAHIPVTAEFSGTPTSGLAPLLVDFTNGSTGDYNTCSWDFGDGTSDVCSNPSHTYTQAGTYQVSLTVSGPGGSDTETKAGYITVTSASTIVEVRVEASSDDAEERASGSVNLTSSDLELVFDGSREQTVGMRFNGISIPQDATITNAYIQFQVDEVDSGETMLTIRGEAHDNAPTFTNASNNISSRIDPTTPTVDWSPAPWTSRGAAGPDQQTPDIASIIQEIVDRPGWSTGNSLVIIITGSGERTAESFDGDSSGAPLLHMAYTAGPPIPVAADFSGSLTNGPAPLLVNFTNLSSGSYDTCDWDFGDGTSTDCNDPSHTYTQPGTYSVVLTVTGPGGTDAETKLDYITVSEAPVTADFSGSPASGPAPLTVNFTNNSTGNYNTCNWDFGDGSGSITDCGNPSYTYTQEGTYSVVLTVSGPGGTDTQTRLNYIAVTSPSTTVEVRVAASSDDAEERASGSVNLTSSDLELSFDRNREQTVGMRFNGLNIPQGATIVNAYVQFQVDESDSGPISLTIRGQPHDDAPTFANTTGNISARIDETTPSVPWSPADWLTVGEAGLNQQTPNIAAIIQEIVDRSNWSSGNALVLIITGSGERTAESYDGDAAAAPLLHVEYTAPGSVNAAPETGPIRAYGRTDFMLP